MLDVIESIIHCSLKSFPDVFKTKWEFPISDCTLGIDEFFLIFVLWADVDLIVARKSIHEQKYFASNTIVDNMVNKGSKIVLFWIRNINIPIIDTHSDGSLFFHDKNNVGNPLS